MTTTAKHLAIALCALKEIEAACPVGGGPEKKGAGLRLSLIATHALRQISGAAPTSDPIPELEAAYWKALGEDP